MARHAVIKGAGYILAAAPDMVLHNGTTQTMERRLSPKSPYLTEIRRRLRTFDQEVSYPPNQVFIGNRTPEELIQFADVILNDKVRGAAARIRGNDS